MPDLIRPLITLEPPEVYGIRKDDEDFLTLSNGCSISINTLTERMGQLGFDTEVVAKTAVCLKEGGVWYLTLTPSQIRVIEG